MAYTAPVTFANGVVGGTKISAANLNSVVLSLATYALQLSPGVSPMEFGAAGDGSTNDATAIQSAIASGYPVVIDRHYHVTSSLTPISGTTIRGTKSGKITGPPSASLLIFNASDVTDLTFDGLHIDGQTTSGTENNNAELIRLSGACARVRIRNCRFQRSGGDAVRLGGSIDDALVDGCTFHDNRGNDIVVGGTSTTATRVRIRGNSMKNTTQGECILVYSGDQIEVSGNHAENVYQFLTLSQTEFSSTSVRRAVVTNNTVDGVTFWYAIDCKGPTEAVIANNVISNGIKGAINSSQTSLPVSIVNNVIDDCIDGAIIFTASPDCLIAGNTVTGATGLGTVVRITANGDNARIIGNTSDAITLIRSSAAGAVIVGNRISTPAGVGIDSTGARPFIANNVVSYASGRGISVSGVYPKVNGNFVRYCTSHGIVLSSTATMGTVNGNTALGNTGSGILLEGSTEAAVTGNRCFDDQATKTQTHGIRETGAANYNAITGNNARGNSTASITTVGANTVNSGNVT